MVLSPAPTAAVHRLPATSSTVHWGYFDPRLEPVLTVSSGDLVAIETLTHHAGDAPDLLMDAGITDVFERVTDLMSVSVDFTVTQVVDQRQGVHGRIDKRCFPRWIGIPA
jgi:acetamidase/formamidase